MKNFNIKQLSDLIIDQAKKKGFGSKLEEINVLEKFALIHSEVSEAFEAYRHKKIEGKDEVGYGNGRYCSESLTSECNIKYRYTKGNFG